MQTPANTNRAQATTLREAARLLKEPLEWVKTASRATPCRTPGGRFLVAPLRSWIAKHRRQLESGDGASLPDQKLAEQIRRLRLANNREESRLVELAWVRERFGRVMGDMNALRDRSLANDPKAFTSARGDVAECRIVLRGLWDRWMGEIQANAKHFEQ